MIIRDERPDDIPAIRDLIAAAFGQKDEAALVDALRADGDVVLSLVAAERERVVGHVLFSPMTAPLRALALAPVSVAPDRQREGIGGRLIRAGLDRAERERWQAVFVVGDPVYYRRFGFEAEAPAGFDCDYAGPYLMALGLGGPMTVREGRLQYPRAFSALS